MDVKTNLRKRFRSAFRVMRGKEKKEEARAQASKAKAVLKKAEQESRGKKSFKERLLSLTKRLHHKNNSQ